jgi:hypothetical protein
VPGFDPALAEFITVRMRLLRGRLVENSAMLPLLRNNVSTENHFLSLARRTDPAIIVRALDGFRKGVGEVVETDALLEALSEKCSVNDDAAHEHQHYLTTDTGAPAKRRRKKSPEVGVGREAARLSSGSIRADIRGENDNPSHRP